MSETLQWVTVGVAVLVSAIVLVRRMRRQASANCDCRCDSCPMGEEFAQNCEDRK